MIKTLIAAAIVTQGQTCALPMAREITNEKPACNEQVILLSHWDAPINCDVSPPMTIVIRIQDTSEDFQKCLDWGGQLMHDDEIPMDYCINIDY